MTKPSTVLKAVGPKLVPFVKAVVIFFVLYGNIDSASVVYTVVKCVPILCLMAFVLMHGMHFTTYYSYSWTILIGLGFSCLGDAFLVWKSYGYFIHGMAAFAVAQGLYAVAFGFQRFGYYSFSIVSVLGSTILALIYPGLSGILTYAAPVYVLLISVMVWRAWARVKLFKNIWTWTALMGCCGASLFAVSDTLIAFNKFRWEIPYSHPLIMITYYGAQVLIALSVVDSQADVALKVSAKEEECRLRALAKLAKSSGQTLEKNGVGCSSQVCQIPTGLVVGKKDD